MSLFSEIRFWSMKDNIIIKPSDYGSFKYFSRNENADNTCFNNKKTFCKQRGYMWNLSNKRPYKLKDKLKELEELLLENKVVTYTWNDNKIKLLLSRGVIVIIDVSFATSDIDNILIDRSISSKIYPEVLYGGHIDDQHVAFICSDGRIFCQGGSWKEGYIIEGNAKKRISIFKDYMVLWGGSGSEHPQPWSPLTREHYKANLHFYYIGSKGPELLAYKRTESEPLEVIISKLSDENLIIIEQKVSQRGSVSVELSTFQLMGSILKCTSVVLVPLQTQVSCCALSGNEKYLFLGCIDGSVAILNRCRGTTRFVKASFIPTFAVWHESDALVAISNEKGQLQYYDIALNCVKSQINGEDCTAIGLTDLSSYFKSQVNVENLYWGPKDIMVVFECGPLATVTHIKKGLSTSSLLQQYLVTDKVSKAIELLISLEWDDEVFYILQKIFAYLMKLPLTEENACHLQNTLGSFHCSPILLSPEIKRRYSVQVKALTRRFFHQLVRYGMFEKAFLLAVDIGHHDLFMDLHYCAIQMGKCEMAAAAKAQASALLSQYSSEASYCSRSSCSQCSLSAECSSRDCSPAEEIENVKTFQTSALLPSTSDNLFSTNFMNFNPQSEYAPFNLSVSDLDLDFPKANLVKPTPFLKTSTDRDIKNQSNVQQLSALCSAPRPSVAPPPPLVTVRNEKIEVLDSNTPVTTQTFGSYNQALTIPSISSLNIASSLNSCGNLPYQSYKLYPSHSLNDVRSSAANVCGPTTSLPLVIPATSSNANTSATGSSHSSGGKKHQAKVKFSDTVTAFIVPEVKRPVRPPVPPHLTDPQKELADSLPLCHPNEDYLKDFTPVSRTDSSEIQAHTQSKIKVVHFGVV